MKQLPFRIWLYLVIDFAILVVCFLHIPSLIQRATTPFEVEERKGHTLVTRIVDQKASGNIKTGDTVLQWNGDVVAIPEALEFLSDLSSIGDSVVVSYRHGEKTQQSFITLIPFYPSLRFFIITLFVGTVIWGIGVYILWHGWRDLAGRVLHWVMICFASVVMLTWGAVLPTVVERVVRPYFFFVSYDVGIPLFFFFTTLYPKAKPGSRWVIAACTFIPWLAILAASLYFYLNAVQLHSIAHFVRFQSVYDVFHGALFFYVGGGILNLVHSNVTAASPEERQRSKWILWGFTVAAIPFLFLYILPRLLFSKYLIDQEYATIAYLVIPFTFAVSFIRYRLFDIEVIINRSIVHTVLTLFIGATYLLTVLLLTSMIGGQSVFEGYLYVVAVTLAIALLINPVRKKIQHFVDESLFAARTNYRTAITSLTESIHSVLSGDELYVLIVESIQKIVPSEIVAAYSVNNSLLTLQAYRGAEPRQYIPQTKTVAVALESSPVLALKETIASASQSMNFLHSSFLRDCGFSVCIPMKTESNDILGMVALRPHSVNNKYDEDEIDFVLTVCSQSAEILQRLLLQERIITERSEKKHFEELSKLKSDFVSYVSHELRTPLTSIKMFSELLKRRLRSGDTKGKEYIDIIDGESDRLHRMVSNILDAARIDKGEKEYFPADIDLCETTRQVLQSMKYQIQQYGFRTRFKSPRSKLIVHADADAVAQAIINLVANAIKYSTQKKFLRVEVAKKGRWVFCRVTDHGSGISSEAMPHLFEKFYREPTHSGTVQGVGLGLPLVKHIMDAHNGRVEVRSTPGKGSVFTLFFPLKQGVQ